MELRFVSVDEWIARADERYPCDLPVFSVTDASGRVLTIKPFVALCRDVAIVGGDWIPFYRDGTALLEQMVHTPEHYLRKAINIRSDGARHTLVRAIEAIDEDVVLIGGRDNYYHWLVDFLPRLILSRRVARERKLVVNHDLAQYQLDSLRMVGYGPADLLPLMPDRAIRVRSAVVPSLLASTTVPHNAIPGMLRAAFPPTRSAPTERIYVSRSDAVRRRLTNEPEVIALLERYGFQTFVTGRMSFEEQCNLFYTAKTVVAVHGAGMTNMLFSPAGADVIEIALEEWRPTFMHVLAVFCRHKHEFLSARLVSPDVDGNPMHGMWEADLDALETMLQKRFGAA